MSDCPSERSGIGFRSYGLNYLLPSHAKLDTVLDAEYVCVPADRVLAKMEGAGSKTNMVFLDACQHNRPQADLAARDGVFWWLAFMNAPSKIFDCLQHRPWEDGYQMVGGGPVLYTSEMRQHIDVLQCHHHRDRFRASTVHGAYTIRGKTDSLGINISVSQFLFHKRGIR